MTIDKDVNEMRQALFTELPRILKDGGGVDKNGNKLPAAAAYFNLAYVILKDLEAVKPGKRAQVADRLTSVALPFSMADIDANEDYAH